MDHCIYHQIMNRSSYQSGVFTRTSETTPQTGIKASAPSWTRTFWTALGLAVMALGLVLVATAQDAPADNPPAQVEPPEPSGFPLGIDQNQGDVYVLKDSIAKTVSQALPEGMEVGNIRISNYCLIDDTRRAVMKMKIPTKLYASVAINKDGKPYADMEIFVVGDELNAKKLSVTRPFPYGMWTHNIAVLTRQHQDLPHATAIMEIGKKLNLQQAINTIDTKDLTSFESYDYPLGIDQNQHDTDKLGKSIMATVAKALPPHMEIDGIHISRSPSSESIKNFVQRTGVQPSLYARLFPTIAGSKKRGDIEIAVMANEAQARELSHKFVFPYAHWVDNIIVLLKHESDGANYEEALDLAKRLGLNVRVQ